MKFSCEKALLQNAILTASRAVSPKSTIPALEGLLLEAEDSGTVFCRSAAMFNVLFRINGNGREESTAMGVRTGYTFSRKYSST